MSSKSKTLSAVGYNTNIHEKIAEQKKKEAMS